MEFSPQYSKTAPLVEAVKEKKLFYAFSLTSLVITAMVISFFLPNSFTHTVFAIEPRSFNLSAIFGIMGSWLAHKDANHLLGNISVMVLPLLYFFYQTRKRSAILWFSMIVFAQGFLTWLIAMNGAIGASGLAYALFGFILTGTFRSIGCFLMTALTLALYFVPALQGLIPQDGISWAGHAGGAIAGYLIGKHFNNLNKEEETSFAYKEKFRDKVKRKWKDLKWKYSPRRKNIYGK